MVRKAKLEDLYNEDERKRLAAIRLQMSPQLSRRHRTRARSPEEKELLFRAIRDEQRRLEREGVLQINGRKWKLTINREH